MIFTNLLKMVFGSSNDRILRKIKPIVAKINALEVTMLNLSEEQILVKTLEFKQRVASGESLDSILPEAFALVREAAHRVLNMRHFDVQLVGGIILHQGKIAEMCTGEGKTLVTTLPAYLNALSGKSVHIVTVNDYLVQRDAAWMEPVYKALGLTVGVIVSDLPLTEKQIAYRSDIVYATNSELGFDYLRDKMAYSLEDCVQNGLNFAIVDEVDSILIDEARTPLIISGAAEDSSIVYRKIAEIAPMLNAQIVENGPGDYTIDEKSRQVFLTEDGHTKIENILEKENLLKENKSLYHPINSVLLHHMIAALRAKALFKRDVDYIVLHDEVVIIDEHTGRTMSGRRWSDGLHQAVEAKERVKIQNENQTMASTSYQNFFRLYNKLAGMTGTADTEAYEFQEIYGLEVVVIPTNRPLTRIDATDLVYLSQEAKYAAILLDLQDCVKRQQPVLVGTISIESSEFLSNMLVDNAIPHEVLNAKNHAREADIIAQAGRPGAVTIATNMAGRGTDIVLGGNLKSELQHIENLTPPLLEQLTKAWQERHEIVLQAGGLRVVGTERHESRRIDNQLRGRSGRQGDVGSTQFYLALDDGLMRIFASDNVANMMRKIGKNHSLEAITHPMVSRGIENAQRRVEARNFEIRKQMLEYDDVSNEQRLLVYKQRDELMHLDDISEHINGIWNEIFYAVFCEYIPEIGSDDPWDVPGLTSLLAQEFGFILPQEVIQLMQQDLDRNELFRLIVKASKDYYAAKEQIVGSSVIRSLEKSVMLYALDTQWREHLYTMDSLRQGIYLRGYAQKDPRQEYKREAFGLFNDMLHNIKREVIAILLRTEIRAPQDAAMMEEKRRQETKLNLNYNYADAAPENNRDIANNLRIGRNAPCPCGSLQKYKNCHGIIKE